jgi:regulator of protease activity HflC (stomatin/prohibitin superfamily)
MSTASWVIVVVVAVPVLAVLVWLVIGESLVRVPSGSLGLLLVKGRATETALVPGPHFVPALRRSMMELYPSVELSYHAVGTATEPPTGAEGSELDRSGPPLTATLGDRATVVLGFTVRFRLVPQQLRLVHTRFGPAGIFPMARDTTTATLSAVVRAPGVGVDDMFGASLADLERAAAAAVAEALATNGVEMVAFSLGAVELGTTGEVIQATVRAPHELRREQAQAPVRLARATNDATLQGQVTLPSEDLWRYREMDLWTGLVERSRSVHVSLRGGPDRANPALADDVTTTPSPPPADE